MTKIMATVSTARLGAGRTGQINDKVNGAPGKTEGFDERRDRRRGKFSGEKLPW